MATYREQLEVLKSMRLREGETRRLNCPFCGGGKTFTVSRNDGTLLWNCYKASCNAGGRQGTEMSAEAIKRRLNGEQINKSPILKPIPTHLVSPSRHKAAMEYLDRVNSRHAFETGLLKVRFAPAENRVLFFNQSGLGAVGRALDKRKPKWNSYGDVSELFTIGDGDLAVVVEDAASAASVSRISQCSGCALLGTHAKANHRTQLSKYKRVFIALDKDASKKAIKLKSTLEGRVHTSVVLLDEDLKYATESEIRELLGL